LLEDEETFNKTRDDKLGNLLLSLLGECTNLADKQRNPKMNLSTKEICDDFLQWKAGINNNIRNAINNATRKWEQDSIERELNSHNLNEAIRAPRTFSAVPTLVTTRQRADIMRFVPRGSSKFSGVGNPSILEYLLDLNITQEQWNLSLKEFLQLMLQGTTGKAHTYLVGRIIGASHEALDVDPSDLYHNLMMRYDNRITPEEARIKLHNFKALKSGTLASMESAIQELANRATSNLPAGSSRDASYNHETIHAIIRALPVQSAMTVRNQYNQLSTRLSRSATASELSRLLNQYRYTIDQDISAHGAGEDRKGGFKNNFSSRPQSGNLNNRRFTTYSLAQGPVVRRRGLQSNQRDNPYISQTASYASRRPNYAQIRRPIVANNNASFTPYTRNGTSGMARGSYNNNNNRGSRPFRGRGQSFGSGRGATYTGRTNGYGNGSANRSGPNNSNNRFRPGQNNGANNGVKNYCSLCGKRDHRAVQGCEFMVNDAGRKLDIMPCKDTCPDCPPHVQPRLSHPSFICPYRPGFGPLRGQ
jgi:hypothetical protein